MSNLARVLPHQPTKTDQSSALCRVAIIAPSGTSLHRLRGGLIAALTARRHDVRCYAPGFDAAECYALDVLRAEHQPLPPHPAGLAVLTSQSAVSALTEEFISWAPHIVLAYGADTALLAVKAAKWAKVGRIITLVNDCPNDKRDARSLRAIGRTLELVDAAIFHNSDDPNWLRDHGHLPGDLPFLVVPGAGVDLAYHLPQPLPPLTDVNTPLAMLPLPPLTEDSSPLASLNPPAVTDANGPPMVLTRPARMPP